MTPPRSRKNTRKKTIRRVLKKPVKETPEQRHMRLMRMPLTTSQISAYEEMSALPKSMRETVSKRAGFLTRQAAQRSGLWGRLDETEKVHLVSVIKEFLIENRTHTRFRASITTRFGPEENWPDEYYRALMYRFSRVGVSMGRIRSTVKRYDNPAFLQAFTDICGE